MKYFFSILLTVFLFGCTSNQETVFIKAGVKKTSTLISVTNNDSFSYEDVEIELNEDYSCKISKLTPCETKEIMLCDFCKEDGTRFNFTETKPNDLTITAKVQEGKFGYMNGSFN